MIICIPYTLVSKMTSSAVPLMPLTKPAYVFVFCWSMIGIPFVKAKKPGPFRYPSSPTWKIIWSSMRWSKLVPVGASCLAGKR